MFHRTNTARLALASTALLIATASNANAGVIANWSFDVADVADLGTAIVTTVDSVSGLVATPHPSNAADPIYGSGLTGSGLDAAANLSVVDGILEVADPTGILTGHANGASGATSFQIDLDVNMNSVSSGTWAIVRNGHIDSNSPGTSFNLFTQSDGAVGFIVRGVNGNQILGRTDLGNILDPIGGWQHITAAWDGDQVTIAVDGILQVLDGLTGDTFVAGDLGGALRASDANMGIGGLRRSGDPGSIGQFFDGAIDNLVISNTIPIPGDINGDGFVGIADLDIVLGNWNAGTPPTTGNATIPEPATLGLMTLGGLAMLRRNR